VWWVDNGTATIIPATTQTTPIAAINAKATSGKAILGISAGDDELKEVLSLSDVYLNWAWKFNDGTYAAPRQDCARRGVDYWTWLLTCLRNHAILNRVNLQQPNATRM